jgi:hypothetical protein
MAAISPDARQSGGDLTLTHSHGSVLRLLTILGRTDDAAAEPTTSNESYQPSLSFAS